MGRLVVVAVLVLAAIAAADGVRRTGGDQTVIRREPREPAPRRVFSNGEQHGFAAVDDGRLTKTRVVRRGKEVLTPEEVDRAFPIPFEEGGTFDIAHVAVAPDGTLAVAVYKFPGVGSVRAGIELWRRDRLVGSFEVPPGSFAGGLGFSADGEFVAAFEQGRREATLFDPSGRWDADVPPRR